MLLLCQSCILLTKYVLSTLPHKYTDIGWKATIWISRIPVGKEHSRKNCVEAAFYSLFLQLNEFSIATTLSKPAVGINEEKFGKSIAICLIALSLQLGNILKL